MHKILDKTKSLIIKWLKAIEKYVKTNKEKYRAFLLFFIILKIFLLKIFDLLKDFIKTPQSYW